MFQEHPDASAIVIVNWNTKDLLAQCLESVYTTAPDISAQVWVVDNASADGSPQMVRERFPQVRLIENRENVGFARANNRAICASTGRYVVLLNSDTIVLPNALTRMIAFMDSHPEAAIVGARLLNPDRSFQASHNDFPGVVSALLTVAGLSRLVYGRYHPSHPPETSRDPLTVDWVGGACLAVRRQAIDQGVGLLDEDYFMYGEEMDWCHRFGRAGWKVYYLPEAEVIHLGGQSSRLVEERKLLWLSESTVHFFRKHRAPLLAGLLREAMRFIAALKALVWLLIGYLLGSKREAAWRKVRANWRLATWSEA